MKVHFTILLLLSLVAIALATTNPIRTVQVIDDPTEIFAEGETPVRVIELDDLEIRADEDDPYRLPTSVLPTHYTIKLTLQDNFGPNGVFTGSVEISLNIVEAVQQITLHSQDLTIDANKINLVCNGGNTNLFSSLSNDTSYSKITIASTVVLAAESTCTLQINDYVGILNDDMNGFYRSSYTNKNGETE